MMLMLLLSAGWGLLACSQPRQFSRIVRHGHLSRPVNLAMRSAGAVLSLVGLAIMVRAEGPAFGAIAWVCLLSVSAMAVVLILAWWPRLTSRV